MRAIGPISSTFVAANGCVDLSRMLGTANALKLCFCIVSEKQALEGHLLQHGVTCLAGARCVAALLQQNSKVACCHHSPIVVASLNNHATKHSVCLHITLGVLIMTFLDGCRNSVTRSRYSGSLQVHDSCKHQMQTIMQSDGLVLQASNPKNAAA